MNKIWVTSDLHIGHDKDFIYKPRGFDSIESHDKALVDNWNSLVADDDTVYVLGDVVLQHGKDDLDFKYGIDILSQLNGQLVIIRGNHDSVGRMHLYAECENVLQADPNVAALYLDYGKYNFCLSHNLIGVSDGVPKPVQKTTINLLGHTHSKEEFYSECPFYYNVALDAHDMKPVVIDEIIQDVLEQKSRWRG